MAPTQISFSIQYIPRFAHKYNAHIPSIIWQKKKKKMRSQRQNHSLHKFQCVDLQKPSYHLPLVYINIYIGKKKIQNINRKSFADKFVPNGIGHR